VAGERVVTFWRGHNVTNMHTPFSLTFHALFIFSVLLNAKDFKKIILVYIALIAFTPKFLSANLIAQNKASFESGSNLI